MYTNTNQVSVRAPNTLVNSLRLGKTRHAPTAMPVNSSEEVKEYLQEEDPDVSQDLIKELENEELETGRLLEVKQLDMIWDNSMHTYTIRDAAIATEGSSFKPSDPHPEFAFIVQRTFEDEGKRKQTETVPHADGPVTLINIKSPFFKYAARQVMGKVPGISWTARPLLIDALILVSYLEDFQRYLDSLRANQNQEKPTSMPPGGTLQTPQVITSVIAHVDFLLGFLRQEFKDHIETLESLLRHGEITFNMLFHILRPQTLLFTNCAITGEPRVLKLIKAQWAVQGTWALHTVYVAEDAGNNQTKDYEEQKYGFSSFQQLIPSFNGTRKISSLNVYPLNWHPNSEDIKEQLIRRGEKWSSLTGVHHLQYSGFANAVVFNQLHNGVGQRKVQVTGRVMVDIVSFSNYQAEHKIDIPPIISPLKIEAKLNNDHLLLTPPFVHGYILERKIWARLLVDNLSPISWNNEAFQNLVLPQDRKELLKKLVKTHRVPLHEGGSAAFDDFIQNKGRGLVIHLYGNPGVGKSLTAEATSEHLQKPLYMIGAGDLGTQAPSVDGQLTKVMNLAMMWGAVLLVDEADVFLEKRTLKDLERNAMVAVFLRRLEYFGGILFLTTNMVESFDHAFQSRLHLSLLYPDLSAESMRKIWVAFTNKAVEGQQQDTSLPDAVGKTVIKRSGLTNTQLDVLCKLKINGRQIKNTVATATILANSQAELLSYEHLRSILDATQHF